MEARESNVRFVESAGQRYYIEEPEWGEEGDEELEPFISFIEKLDRPRELPEPCDLTFEHLKQIENELGLIKLCWPQIENPEFEGRTQFPESYLKNNEKEKLLLLYAENFRKQFCYRFPNRKQLFLASDNECGMQKMVCTTIRPTTLPYTEIETWQTCASFVGNYIKYEPLSDPVLIPNRLFSPHTVFMRQSGHSFEIATALCSLLIGLGYDAYVVSGYATQDATSQTMCRVDSPYPPKDEEITEVERADSKMKYVMKAPRDLRSKFLLMMEQRQIDKAKAEELKAIETEKDRRAKEEEPPVDELEGLRVHGWVLLLANGREDKPTFIESSTGTAHDFDSKFYTGIESVWNHLNYWVNMQDCSFGLDKLSYDFSNVANWEHILAGEPIHARKEGEEFTGMDEEEATKARVYGEKHLDMPISWSERISLNHDALANKYPNGMRSTQYKRCTVKEYAPYILEDGLTVEIHRYDDFECTDLEVVECRYENRSDKLYKSIHDCKTGWFTEYFRKGRDDAIVKHQFYKDHKNEDDERIIDFNDDARHDGLSKIEIRPENMSVSYIGRDDKLYYRDIVYAKKGSPPPGVLESHRRIILNITEKYNRDESKIASEDIAVKEFAVIDRVIDLRFHYGPGKVTASTRQFIKPPVAEMGERLRFIPELTSGYQAEIDAKPPRKLKLFLLLQQQLDEEEKSLHCIREIEDQVSEFLLLREKEMAINKLDVSLFNREQNIEHKTGMHEREKQHRELREKEVEEEIDYLTPQLARIGHPSRLNHAQALAARNNSLEEFKQMLLNRAIDLQRQFETAMEQMQVKKQWYVMNQDLIPQEEEVLYFEEIHDLTQLLRTLEIRLARHRDLSGPRYQAMVNYLDMHPMLQVLYRKK